MIIVLNVNEEDLGNQDLVNKIKNIWQQHCKKLYKYGSYLNEIINLFDTTLTDLDARVGLDKTEFDNANACGLTPVLDVTGYTVKDNKYYSSEVVKGLVGSSVSFVITEDYRPWIFIIFSFSCSNLKYLIFYQ